MNEYEYERVLEKLVSQREQLEKVKEELSTMDKNVDTAHLLVIKMYYPWWHPMYWWELFMTKVSKVSKS